MKLRYLAFAGLLVITIGCFLPFRVDLWESRPVGFWYLPIPGIFFMLISKEGPFGNSRVLGGVFGLLIGIITVFSIIDTMSFPEASGIHITYQGPVTILSGCILACLGGFIGYTRTSSRNFHLGTLLSLASIGIISMLEILTSLPLIISSGFIFPWLIIFSLAMICIGSIIIVKESRRTIQQQ